MTDHSVEEPGQAADSAAERDETGQPEPQPGVDGRSRLGGMANTIAGAAGPMISAARRPVDNFASGARRFLNERPGARVRRVRRMGLRPLRNLWDEHPEARRASIRELGLRGVPVDRIVGTAVEGAAQRGGDFLPLRDRRSDDWRGRWQRIRRALDQLESLPPVDLIKFGDEYWVVDGHNRVAAALYIGQVEMDAVVEELRLPGMAPEPPSLIAPVLEGSMDLRNAGAGRRSRQIHEPRSGAPDRRSGDEQSE